jgi:hypothetical protein
MRRDRARPGADVLSRTALTKDDQFLWTLTNFHHRKGHAAFGAFALVSAGDCPETAPRERRVIHCANCSG